jgi:hypothetical protein
MKKRILFVALLGTMSSAYSQDGTFDARSIGMGGAGVAAANGLNAIYQNPSALAGLPKEKFAMEAPFSFRLLDEGDLKNNLGTLNTNATALSNAMAAFQMTPTSANALQAATALTNFNNSMNLVSNKSLMGSMYGGAFLALPKPSFAFALKLDAKAEFGGVFNYANGDQAIITTLANNLTVCANTANPVNCNAAAGQVGPGGQINGLTSDFKIRGVVIGEVGVTAARHVDDWAGIDLGITPKFMKITSFDMASGAQSGNANATSTSGNQKSDSAFNLDLGVSKQYTSDKGNVIKTGLVAKNLFPKTIKTALGNTIDIAPQVTVGGAYGTGWFTGTVDVDVIKNKALVAGFTKESRFVRLGAEFDAKGWAQVRFGYRHDLAGNYPGLPSIGLGLNLKVLSADLSLAAAGKKEMVAAFQVGTHF